MMHKPEIVVAYDRNRTIGYNGHLPWQGELPGDMRHFKALTIGNVVVIGRKTYESIQRPLPERENIVLSTQLDLTIEGCRVVNDFPEVLELDEADRRKVFIIGGSAVYQAFLPFTSRIHATEIEAEFDGDVWFPMADEVVWTMSEKSSFPADARNKYAYSFVTYDRTPIR